MISNCRICAVSRYCSKYLNDNKTAVNWTRVGHVIATATKGRSNFAGIYIDDFCEYSNDALLSLRA